MNILSVISRNDLANGGPIYLCNSQKKFLKKKCNIKIFFINEVSLLKILLYLLGFKIKKIADILLKFNLIHFHEIWNIRIHFLALLLRKFSIPFIFSLHGNLDIWSTKHNYFIKKIFLYLFKKNFLLATGLQVSSYDELNEARIFFNEKNINYFLIHNGVEIKIDESTLKKKEINNDIKLLFFGRIHPKKGIELLLNALNKLNYNKKKYLLTIVGPGKDSYIKEIIDLINNLKIDSFVTILSPVYDNISKIKIISSHDIFILPSYEEADSIALKESLACGTPVIISKQCRLNDVVNYNCGLIIDNNKSDNLVLAIKKMSNKDLINTMAKNSIKLINEKYTSDLMNKNFYDIYLDVMSGTRFSKNWSCNNIILSEFN
jgi:glycosyltransferase involved in cell wall biosynthesis